MCLFPGVLFIYFKFVVSKVGKFSNKIAKLVEAQEKNSVLQ
jgi:hypothetical protein